MKNILLISLFIYTINLNAFTSISSKYNGLQLTNESGLARLGKWSDNNKLDFSGYGQIKMGELCLGANGIGLATWKPCYSKAKSQIWLLKDNVLKNEKGYCAEVESYTNSVLNPRLKTRVCSDSNLQKWDGHE